MDKKYKVKVNVDREKDIYLSVTHNGYQWNSINIYDANREIPLIIAALQRHLTSAIHSDGEDSGENEVCNRYRDAGYCQCSQY